MEAALRTVVEILEKRSSLKSFDFTAVRGNGSIKESDLTVAGTEVNW